ncbi:Rieske (2Fe-2S) protein [Streptomyces sp. NPDC089799]|uniref:Rieske (2Fe-2S) protein n=1 Tax=Streptomyces sp. NPDC089799 TaxID=3155066 RepID=UPI003414DB9F
MSDPLHPGPARRTVLGAGAAALACCGLTACGDDGGEQSAPPASPPASPPMTAPNAAAPTTSPSAAGGTALVKTADVPVGGGTILKAEKVVVTQPTAGSFKGFSAICTHEGCIVAKVENGTIDCPCHGSKFDITDGAVAHGPAQRPLPPRTIKVSGGEISLA